MNGEDVKKFLEGLNKLSEETGIIIWGCSCCGSPNLEERTKLGHYEVQGSGSRLTFVGGDDA